MVSFCSAHRSTLVAGGFAGTLERRFGVRTVRITRLEIHRAFFLAVTSRGWLRMLGGVLQHSAWVRGRLRGPVGRTGALSRFAESTLYGLQSKKS